MKKHVQKFESFQIKKRLDDAIQESVMQVNDIYKVKAIVDIPKSLINQVIKKVKDESGKDLRNFYGDQDIAEELIKYINQTFVNADSIPTAALVGGEAPKVQGQAAQAQAQVAPVQAEAAPAQAQVAPVEGQAEAQPAAQVQVEAQPAAQTQAQPEAQATGEFENVEEGEEEAGETEEEETEEEKAQREAEEGEEENLPL